MNDLINTSAISPTIITATVAFLGLIIQSVTFFVKHKYESKSNFEEVLKEKMEKIYSPLLIEFYESPEKGLCLSQRIKELTSKYGYLLSNSLLIDILELEKAEKEYKLEPKDEAFKKEYENLKDKIFLKLRKDFDDLQSIYNKNFRTQKNKFFMTTNKKIGFGVRNFCIILTVLFGCLILLLLFISWLKKIIPQSHNTSFQIYLGGWLIISFITVFISLLIYFANGFDKLTDVIRKFKRYYIRGEYVERTANYYCRICKKQYKLYKNSKFPFCENHSFIQKIIAIFKLYPWALCDDKYYRIIKKKKIKKENKEKENDQQIETHCDTSQIEKSN